MIGKAKSVKGSLSGALYKEREDKQSELIYQHHMFGESAQERWAEMKEIADLNSRIEKPFVENVISPDKSVGDQLSSKEWADLAKDYSEKMNFGNNQWYAVLHKNTDEKHLHLFVNRVDFSGKTTVQDNYIGIRSGKATEQLCKSRGWKTAQELSRDKKREISTCLERCISNSRNLGELKEKMLEKGYMMELSYKNDGSLNGARIISSKEYKNIAEMSRREQLAKKGFKLSEIDRNLKIKDIEKKISKNYLKKRTYGRGL